MIGLGMSMVFGIMKLTNLAHGDLMILGTYLIWVIVRSTGVPLILAVLIAVVIMMIIGFLMQNFLVNKVVEKGQEPALMIMFGVSIALSNLLLKIFGANNQSIQNPLSTKNIISTGSLSVSAMYFFSFVVGLVLILGLNYIMQKTNFGRSIRATSENTMAAELMGVSTKKAYSLAMMISMGTAAIGGALVGATFVFYPSSGTQYLIIAFGVVVIGGMGSLVGTLLGGIVLGVAQVLGGYFLGSGFQMLVAYVVLLIILATRPNGLLASASRK
jgi:branched-chain amino acid transport system permease protein